MVLNVKMWVKALPSIRSKDPAKDIFACVKHWPMLVTRRTKRKSSSSSRFTFYSSNSKIFCLSEFRCTYEKRWNKELRLRVSVETLQQETRNHTIASWESLNTFGDKLDVQVINNENSLTLIEVHGGPPRTKSSFYIFKYYTISCFKGFMQNNDPVNSFTHRVEQSS